MRAPAASKERGTTLLEMMAVVSIVGIFAAMAGAGISDMVKTSRVVGSTKGLIATLRSARVRAAAARCPFYVQVNGPTYAQVSATGFPTRPNSMSLLRKGNCASAVMSFEAGDVVVDSQSFGPDTAPGEVVLELPSALLATLKLADKSMVVAYTAMGERAVWLDATGGGETAFAEVAAPTAPDVNLTIHENSTAPEHITVVVLPTAGDPRLQ